MNFTPQERAGGEYYGIRIKRHPHIGNYNHRPSLVQPRGHLPIVEITSGVVGFQAFDAQLLCRVRDQLVPGWL